MAGEDDVTVQDVLFVDEVVGIVRVVEIVGVENIVVQGEHIVECGIEGEVVAKEEVVEEEVVEEEVVKEVIEKDVGMITAVRLVEEEVFEERHLKGFPGDPQGRAALNTLSWRLPVRCFFSSSDL